MLLSHLDGQSGVYVFNVRNTDSYKIGKTSHIINRLKPLKTARHETLDLVYFLLTSDLHAFETLLKKSFNNKRLGGEWFQLDFIDLKRIPQIAAENNAHTVDASLFRHG